MPNRREVAAGLLLAGSIGMTIVGALTLPNLLSPSSEYLVEFPLALGAEGACSGSPVMLAGMRVGVVVSVAHGIGGLQPEPHAATLLIRIDGAPQLRLLDKVQWIVPVGAGAGRVAISPSPQSSPLLPSGGVVIASPQPGPAETALGARAAARLALARESLAFALPELSAAKSQIGERMSTIQQNIKSIDERLQPDSQKWSSQLEVARVNASKVDARLQEFRAIDSIAAVSIADAKGKYERLHSSVVGIAESASALRTSLDSKVSAPTAELIERARASYESGAADLKVAQHLLENIKEIGGTARAELTMTAYQFAQTQREIVFSPWRLLGGIFDNGSESLELARAMAMNAIELQEAARAARDLLERAGELEGTNPELWKLLRQWLDAATKRSEALDRVIQDRLGISGAASGN